MTKRYKMDLSLDEIIKKKKFQGNTKPKRFVRNKPPIQTTKRVNKTVIDARNKIIQKNRAKIRDAREKLAQITKASGDARLKLQKRRKEFKITNMNTNSKLKKPIQGKREFVRKDKPKPIQVVNVSSNAPKYPKKIPNMIGVPRGYVDYDNMEVDEEYDPASVPAIRRTVHNDILPPFGSYKIERGPSTLWNNDPFDCYEIPINRPPDVSEPVHLHRQIRNISPDIPPKSILRSNRQVSPAYSRRYIPEQSSHLSYEMRTRLERAPDPHASMGIFANPLKPPSSSLGSLSSSSSSGYRIVVSNLHNSVTQSDIKELFEDIGELHEARLVRPGVAEVIFKSLKDAENAVDTYHNRQLDGQPMKCLLVNPRSSNKPTAPAIKAAGVPSSSSSSSSNNNYNSLKSSGKTPLEIDIDALHKVLFRRH